MRRRLGAPISLNTQDDHHKFVDSLYSDLSDLHSDLGHMLVATPLISELDALQGSLESLDVRLRDLDAANEAAWLAEVEAWTGQLRALRERVKAAKARQLLFLSGAVGALGAGLTYVWNKRIRRLRSPIFVGSVVAAASATTTYVVGSSFIK